MTNINPPLQRLGQFVLFRDRDGSRHLVRIGSIQVMSDDETDGQETLLVAANKIFCVPCPLEELAGMIDPQMSGDSLSRV